MKISREQAEMALKYRDRPKTKRKSCKFTVEEMKIIRETLKQMPENVRHLNYGAVKKESRKASPDIVTEKLITRFLVDRLLQGK